MDVSGFRARRTSALIAALLVPVASFAQASPFLTGAEALQTNIYAWLAPLAIIAIIVLGILAMAGRISWGVAGSVMVGVVIAFGAPQIVTWIRGMAGV
jgi:type IV secretion system protein VirB2